MTKSSSNRRKNKLFRRNVRKIGRTLRTPLELTTIDLESRIPTMATAQDHMNTAVLNHLKRAVPRAHLTHVSAEVSREDDSLKVTIWKGTKTAVLVLPHGAADLSDPEFLAKVLLFAQE